MPLRLAGAIERRPWDEGGNMVALVVLVLLLALLGGLGFAVHVLWYVLVIAVILWLIGFFVGGLPEGGGRRQWYGRW
jgi:hypothetical protein